MQRRHYNRRAALVLFAAAALFALVTPAVSAAAPARTEVRSLLLDVRGAARVKSVRCARDNTCVAHYTYGTRAVRRLNIPKVTTWICRTTMRVSYDVEDLPWVEGEPQGGWTRIEELERPACHTPRILVRDHQESRRDK